MQTVSLETLNKQEEELTIQLNAVRDYRKAFYPDNVQNQKKEETSPSQTTLFGYKKSNPIKKQKKAKKGKITVADKVYSALEAIGTGKTKDVAEKMIELFLEYQKTPEKAIKDARFHISAMKNKRIEVVEEGIGNSGSTYKVITL